MPVTPSPGQSMPMRSTQSPSLQPCSVMSFMDRPPALQVGATVDGPRNDPAPPHTKLSGGNRPNQFPPACACTVDPDGALHAVISSPTDSVHSGFIVAAAQDRIGLPQTPIGNTRFRITFTAAGTYPYICALHDGLGMTGRITVLP